MCQAEVVCFSEHLSRRSPRHESTTVAVDLAKNVFELAVAGADWRILERHRLSRRDSRVSSFTVHPASGHGGLR